MSTEDQVNGSINAILNERSILPEAVAYQVGLMSVVSLVTILAFNILRPNNKIIYEPKVKYHQGDKPPPRISDSFLGWLPPLMNTKEPELVEKIGLDAVTFLRFLRMFRLLFTGIAIFCCGVLMPVNALYNIRNVQVKHRDVLSMLTISAVRGRYLYAHVAGSYVITMLVCGAVWINWRQMVVLRRAWFRSPEYVQAFYARTLTVLHVPKKNQSDEGLRAIFESVQVPYPTTSVHIGRKVGRLPELIDYHNETVCQFEQVLVGYLKGGRIAKKRPTIRQGGFLGMGGVKKDAIEFYTNKLKRTEAAIEEYRNSIDTRKPENYGFASMAAVPYAHVVAQMLANKHPKGTDIHLAPNPKDIIWENMNKTDSEITRKKLMGWLWLAVVCFFNTIPLLIISFLANLNAIADFPIFKDTLAKWRDASQDTFSAASAILPPAVSALFGFFLPIIMRSLSQYMGALTHSRLDRAVVARYFAFLVISQLVLFTLIGVIFNSIRNLIIQIQGGKSINDILENLKLLPGTINRTYINQSSYWITWFPVRGFLIIFDLAQIVNLLWISFKTRVFGRTPRDIREFTQPPEFPFSVYYSNVLFMGTVSLVFAPIAPLVTLCSAVVFWLYSWVYKYQLMFVFITKVETGGRLWNVCVNRLLVSAIIGQLLMVLTMGLQFGFRTYKWVWAMPPILMIIIFKMYITATFDKQFRHYIPTEDELRSAKIHSERSDSKGNRLEKRFGHPSLHNELYTPMLHKKMMPLLSQVYSGRIENDSVKMQGYGGQQMSAQVIPGGIKIAAIDQHELEYDPIMYQRDRGELDWDQRSMASTNILMDNTPNLQPSKSGFFASRSESPAPAVPGYDRYMSGGPAPSRGPQTPGQEFELSRFDSRGTTDNQPLLGHAQQPGSNSGYFEQQRPQYSGQYSNQSPSVPPSMHQDQSNDGYREAPIHRPYPSRGPSEQSYTGSQYSRGGGNNMAGRGAHRGGY